MLRTKGQSLIANAYDADACAGGGTPPIRPPGRRRDYDYLAARRFVAAGVSVTRVVAPLARGRVRVVARESVT